MSQDHRGYGNRGGYQDRAPPPPPFHDQRDQQGGNWQSRSSWNREPPLFEDKVSRGVTIKAYPTRHGRTFHVSGPEATLDDETLQVMSESVKQIVANREPGKLQLQAQATVIQSAIETGFTQAIHKIKPMLTAQPQVEVGESGERKGTTKRPRVATDEEGSEESILPSSDKQLVVPGVPSPIKSHLSKKICDVKT